ncbi:ABC transporter permease [Guptibacillus algicola]|uniref:ABC transporter permease n=1 Tax=Guptibacillus algicola TaxID=225844 RepID=UPI001CD236A3|nr:ABC transporter permease [Alkalihalobacillus algicola]MCA0987167.1 ABC transporter permease [Alkalihalobacillus algicola]
MMKARLILNKRIKSDARYKYRDLQTAIDWTVLLYILIPAVAIFIAMYTSWWKEAPEWTASIPEEISLIFLYFFSTALSFRTYVEEADQVFVMRDEHGMLNYKKWYTLYSLLRTVIWTIVGICILLPLLVVGWGWNGEEIIKLCLNLILVSLNVTLGKHLIKLIISFVLFRLMTIGLLNVVGLAFIYIVTNELYGNALYVFLLSISSISLVLLIRIRMTLKGTFFQDIIMERGYKQHFTKLFLGPSGSVSTPLIQRRRPFLFRGTRLVFKKNDPVSRILDLYVKWLFRSFDKFQFYLQVVGWSLVAVIMLPLVIKLIVLGFSFYALIGLSHADWKEFSDHQYMKLFQWEESVRSDADMRIWKIISLPCFLLLCTVTGIAIWV